MKQRPSTERLFNIFSELNEASRPSRHEKPIANYLCRFAELNHLSYDRDAQNCVVIRKPATPGHEQAQPVVLMAACTEDGRTKNHCASPDSGKGISLGMALAVLESDDIVHGPLEAVITTTNVEDGMPEADALSPDFIRGRKVINLGSEYLDAITTGAAGVTLQFHRIPVTRQPAPGGKRRWYCIRLEGGLGGHSSTDINEGRCSAVVPAWAILAAIYNEYDFDVSSIRIGEANASIASSAEIIICIPSGEAAEFAKAQEAMMNEWLHDEYGQGDPSMHCTVRKCEPQSTVINVEAFEALMHCLEQTPQGVVKMSDSMQDMVDTSNNVGLIVTETDHIFVSTLTRSLTDADMDALSRDIANVFSNHGATSEHIVLSTVEDAWNALQKLLSQLS